MIHGLFNNNYKRIWPWGLASTFTQLQELMIETQI